MGFLDKLRGSGSPEEEAAEAAREAASAAAEARREQDLQRLAAGGIPTAAEARLAELAAGRTGFTSNLSVADFALTQLDGVRPIAQVMGSSVYKVGWRNYPWNSGWGRGSITEMTTLSQAWNEARGLALGRLAEEARVSGCHAVVDVTFSSRQHDFLSDEIEIVVVGTAVHLPEGGREGPPVLTDLSMPDFTLLRRAGYVPVGVVTATAVFYVAASAATRRLTTGWQRTKPNVEITDFTQGVYTARETALGRATAQAQALGAHGLVGVQVDDKVEIREYERNDTKYEDLIVTFHVIGTGIYQHAAHRPLQPELYVRQNPRRPR
ncbi:heavy metal-binding domain-containing protein [Paraconexibacter antarcticus]|uniref:Heavy metal-binding domain-containing protein n=1 Tax=Paraconexibacter antarcticus TaxID=2949664 RepID=A0ABY5DRC7_9ACTN|nr:heavy metal-binding domain-containing protein [Paraconexibacter antarcticus]UTI64015.1 heavy metal-binding domain-containing protein [Paraconexibacter antarcticus]